MLFRSLFGREIVGIAELLELIEVPIHVHKDEVPWIERTTGVGRESLVAHESDDVLRVGEINIRLLHTPGHTPGSQCFLVDGRLVAGDTLFLQGCGRTDLPGSDPDAMYDSLVNRLAKLPDDTVVYPGHLYSPDGSASLAETKRKNPVLAPRSAEEWLALFGGELPRERCSGDLAGNASVRDDGKRCGLPRLHPPGEVEGGQSLLDQSRRRRARTAPGSADHYELTVGRQLVQA